MPKKNYNSIYLTERQKTATTRIANHYKISEYTAVNRIFDIGLTIVQRSGNNLESAQEIAIGGEIDLVVPNEMQNQLSFIEQVTKRTLALQTEILWISRDASPGIVKSANAKGEQTYRAMLEQIKATEK